MKNSLRALSLSLFVIMVWDCAASLASLMPGSGQTPRWYYHHNTRDMELRITELTHRKARKELGKDCSVLFNPRSPIIPFKMEIINRSNVPFIINALTFSLPTLSSQQVSQIIQDQLKSVRKVSTYCILSCLLVVGLLELLVFLCAPYLCALGWLYIPIMVSSSNVYAFSWGPFVAWGGAALIPFIGMGGYLGYMTHKPQKVFEFECPEIKKPYMLEHGQCYGEYIFMEKSSFNSFFTVTISYTMKGKEELKIIPVDLRQVAF